MSPPRKTRPARRAAREYYQDTQAPLTCLVFLLPLIVLYQAGTIWLTVLGLPESQPQVGAYVLLQRVLGVIGATGYHLPGLLVVAILLIWHVHRRDPWSVRGRTLLGMAGESFALAIPLLVFQDSLQAAVTSPRLHQWLSDAVLSVGAGVDEELVFRLALITLGMSLLVEGLHMPRNGAMVAVVLAAAGVFASYHHVYPATEPFTMTRFLFRTGAGVYLGGIFVLRGFGVAAGCHACYNLIVVTLDLARS